MSRHADRPGLTKNNGAASYLIAQGNKTLMGMGSKGWGWLDYHVRHWTRRCMLRQAQHEGGDWLILMKGNGASPEWHCLLSGGGGHQLPGIGATALQIFIKFLSKILRHRADD
jgi:hypothetical protein